MSIRGTVVTLAILRLAALPLFFCQAIAAQSEPGGLLVDPPRVILTDRSPKDSLTLVNTGTREFRVRVSLIDMQMAADGTITRLPDGPPGPSSAIPIVSFAPKHLVLSPQRPQVIRLLARSNNSVADGEYRSHILIEQLPDSPGTSDDAEESAVQPKSTTVHIKTLVAISLPVIFRKGNGRAVVVLSRMSLTGANGEPAISLVLERSGPFSAYGDLQIETQSGQVVALLKGVAIYSSLDRRAVDVPVIGAPPSKGQQLRVQFGTSSDTYLDSVVRLD